MSDETTSKPAWIRCPECKQLVFNESMNKNAHKLNCPFQIKMNLQKALDRIEKLETGLKGIADQPAEAPAVDLEDIGDWDDDEVDPDDDLADERAAVSVSSSGYSYDDEDEDELPGVPPVG